MAEQSAKKKKRLKLGPTHGRGLCLFALGHLTAPSLCGIWCVIARFHARRILSPCGFVLVLASGPALRDSVVPPHT
ncbi:hypothetical protein TgHK011_006202 [Trichoderma gracile]|nr:hypothetical protein TgHK011_006202 [Trichoderma gracile]